MEDTERSHAVDVTDRLLDFQLPRARYIARGHEPTSGIALLQREQDARSVMLGERTLEGIQRPMASWRASAIKQLVSHVRCENGHVYMYFHSETTLRQAFLDYRVVRHNFRICQFLENSKGITAEDFLSEEIMQEETLRHSVHLRIRYDNQETADFFYLRGETSPGSIADVRSALKPHEPSSLPWTTKGRFPHHSTVAEGYTWSHFNAYAQYAERSLHHAWKRGLRAVAKSKMAQKPARTSRDTNTDLAAYMTDEKQDSRDSNVSVLTVSTELSMTHILCQTNFENYSKDYSKAVISV